MKLDSFQWIQLILDDRDLSFRAKAFAMYFSTYMNIHQDCAWPGYRRICHELHCSSKTVKKYVDELVQFEYLIVGKERVFGNGGAQELNKYNVNIPTKVLSIGKHLIEKVLSDRTKGAFPQDQRCFPPGPKVLSQGKHNNNRITKEITTNNKPSETHDDLFDKPEKKKEGVVYPGWLNLVYWGEFLEHRKTQTGKKLSLLAEQKCLNKLDSLLGENKTHKFQQGFIDRTIENNWKTFYPDNSYNQNNPNTIQHPAMKELPDVI